MAGLVCLDLIPGAPTQRRRRVPRPGDLVPIGPVSLSVGGCVGNTGIALHRLGLRVDLVARIGDDRLGELLRGLVREAVPGRSAHLVVARGEQTSYSLITSEPGRDRIIEHFPGANASFVADDVTSAQLRGADLLHVGYPPLMAALVADGGLELRRLLERARDLGVATSLDLASASLDLAGSGIDWRRSLAAVLPLVDVFLPSLAEACHLLGRRTPRDASGAPDLAAVARLAEAMIELGVAVAGVKLGEHGLLVRTASAARVEAVPLRLGRSWADRTLYSAVFQTDVVGTAGAGDATIAGFLFGLLSGMTPERAVTTACAVGAASTEAPDGTGGVPGWPEVERRLEAGWPRRSSSPGPGWTSTADGGLWRGPDDDGAVA